MPSKSRRPARRPVQPARKAKRAPTRKAPRRSPKAAKRPAKRSGKPARKAAAKRSARPAKKTAKPSRGRAKAKSPAHKAVVQFTEAPRAKRPLRIALFGASGHLGSRIAEEALRRGHHVTALVRHPDSMASIHPELQVVKGDVTDPVQVEVAARNHDVVASAIAPPPREPAALVDAAKALVQAARLTGTRVVAVGGAGSLEVAPGQQLVDSPQFPADWRPVALAHRDALDLFRREGGGRWTVLSPAALIEPGQRTGSFRWGTDALLADKGGDSRISMEDYAVAFVDELESGRSLGKRVTVGY